VVDHNGNNESLLSLSPLNVLTIKILSSVSKHLQKVVCIILFYLFNVQLNGESDCCKLFLC